MNILDIAIIVFVIMEAANVIILYFFSDSRLGNGVAVFNTWFNAKNQKDMELFAKYMTNWVAGTKLIFIVLLLVILLTAENNTKFFAVLAMVLSIATYYFRLNSIIKKLDVMGEITPMGYSKTLWWMITGFIVLFSSSAILYVLI